MRQLCSFTDLEFCPIMVEPEEFGVDSILEVHFEQHGNLFSSNTCPIDPSKAYSWKQKMNDAECAEIERVASELIGEVGYELTGTRAPFWQKGLQKVMERARPVMRSVRNWITKLIQ